MERSLSRISASSFLALLVVVSCIGCDRFRENEINFIGPTWIENICVSEDRPTEVLVRVSGFGGDGCADKTFKNIGVERIGNTIALKPTIIGGGNDSSVFGYGTCSAIVQYSGEATITDLGVGEYEIAYGDNARLRLRIEKEKTFGFLRLKVTNITLEMETSEAIKRFDVYPKLWRVPDPLIETREPVQVTMRVKGFFLFGSQIEDSAGIVSVKREAEEVAVDVSGKVEMTNCMEDINVDGPWLDTEIDLGVFRTGDYRVNVNDSDVRFSVVR